MRGRWNNLPPIAGLYHAGLLWRARRDARADDVRGERGDLGFDVCPGIVTRHRRDPGQTAERPEIASPERKSKRVVRVSHAQRTSIEVESGSRIDLGDGGPRVFETEYE